MQTPPTVERCIRCQTVATRNPDLIGMAYPGPTLLDEEGVCSICRSHEHKHTRIDWAARKAELDQIIESSRGKGEYDVLVPVSGGKDSLFVLYFLWKNYPGLKMLAWNYDPGFLKPGAMDNLTAMIEKLGVDFIRTRSRWDTVKDLMVESLKRTGSPCWHCWTCCAAYPMQLAMKHQIPLVVGSHSRAEHTSVSSYENIEQFDELEYHREYDWLMMNVTPQDLSNSLPHIDRRDFIPFTMPPIEELHRHQVRSLFINHYIPWDQDAQARLLIDELGWKTDPAEGVPPGFEYEKSDCWLVGVKDYLDYLTRGYGRASHLAAIEVRAGRMTPEDAQVFIQKYDGVRPASLDVFLEDIDMDEEELMDLVQPFRDENWEPDYASIRRGEAPADLELWRKYRK